MMSIEPSVVPRAKRAEKMNILKLNGDYRGRMGPFSLHLNKGGGPDNIRTETPLSYDVYRVPICDGACKAPRKNELLRHLVKLN